MIYGYLDFEMSGHCLVGVDSGLIVDCYSIIFVKLLIFDSNENFYDFRTYFRLEKVGIGIGCYRNPSFVRIVAVVPAAVDAVVAAVVDFDAAEIVVVALVGSAYLLFIHFMS